MPEMTADEWDAYGDSQEQFPKDLLRTKAELREACRKRGIPVPANATKHQLSIAIVNHDVNLRRMRRISGS